MCKAPGQFIRRVLLFALACAWPAGRAEVVYRNLGNTAGGPGYYPSTQEYGDELRLNGFGRKVVLFSTEYYGDVPVTNDVTARLRFFANDGPGRYPTPHTLLFESDPFAVSAGYNSITLRDLNVTVPDVFTFSIQFSGTSGTPGNQAGLLQYDSLSVGFSYDDFWMRTGTNWGLFRLGNGLKANFAAFVVVEDMPAARLGALKLVPDGETQFQILGLVGRTCVVQSSSNLASWNSIGLFNVTQTTNVFVDKNAAGSAGRFYRALTTFGGPMKLATAAFSTNGSPQFQITGPENFSFVVQGSPDFMNWTPIHTNRFGPRPFVFADPAPPGVARFYRAVLSP